MEKFRSGTRKEQTVEIFGEDPGGVSVSAAKEIEDADRSYID